MRIPLAHIAARAAHRPPGYQQDVISKGTIIGDALEISELALATLRIKYAEPTPLTVLEMTQNFVGAIGRWATAGFPVATESQAKQRQAICAACPEWEMDARLGLGKCRACGCAGFKAWLATERCPLSKW